MKNIIPKNMAQIDINFDVDDLKSIDVPHESIEYAKNYLESKEYADGNFIGVTSDRKAIMGFDYKHKNQMKFVPELDPCLIYFSSAQMFSKMIYSYKKDLLCNLSFIEPSKNINAQDLGKTMLEFQHFFQFASSYTIMLNSSLEAFINKEIPVTTTYITKEKGETKDIKWILKANLEFKMSKIIPECTNKNFPLEYSKTYESIKDFIKFRNQLIHLSPRTDHNSVRYKEFYRKIIDFKYLDSMYQIKKYINYHQPNLIEERDFGSELYFDIIKNNL
ncbi:hypothetical protein [uncultured Kordia sp.]|uniref:hypothetical protein n=1 Tax=uncultured Kordia sp. TaxID=507699 RepID=UPI002639C5F6|nr:hypothetical protein [uncultured Kordia sp.]